MGNANYNQPLVDSSYQFLITKNDANYGEANIYKKRGANDLVAVISRSTGSQQDRRFQQIKKRLTTINKYMLNVYGCQKVEADDLCSRINLLQVLVEYLPTSIEDDFKDRKLNNLYYDESEIWYIILSLANALNFLQQNQEEFIDLHPCRILFNEQRELKLMDQYLQQESIPNYLHVKMGMRPISYLAPEQVDLFSDKMLYSLNKEKINVFNIGLLCTQLISMHTTDDCYQDNLLNMTVLYERLDRGLNRFKYSRYLSQIIESMLQIQPQDRPTYQSIVEQVSMIPNDQVAQSLFASQAPQIESRRSLPFHESHSNSLFKREEESEVHHLSPEQFNKYPDQFNKYHDQSINALQQNESFDHQPTNQSELDLRIQAVVHRSQQALLMYGNDQSIQININKAESAVSEVSRLDIFPVTAKIPTELKFGTSLHPTRQYDDNRISMIMRNSEIEIQKAKGFS